MFFLLIAGGVVFTMPPFLLMQWASRKFRGKDLESDAAFFVGAFVFWVLLLSLMEDGFGVDLLGWLGPEGDPPQ